MNILLLDNYDSFTYNLLELFHLENCAVDVVYNSVPPSEIEIERYDLLVISPGPSTPKNAGFLLDYIESFHSKLPIFGVCLGFQALVEFFGGELGFLDVPVHGKISEISVSACPLFEELPKKIAVGRYHSIYAKQIPSELTITAVYKDIPMAIEHTYWRIYGVQFHPESILTMQHHVGRTIIKNLLNTLRRPHVQCTG